MCNRAHFFLQFPAHGFDMSADSSEYETQKDFDLALHEILQEEYDNQTFRY